MSQGSKSKRVRVGGILVVALAVVAGSAGAFLATHAGAATGNHEASQTYNVTGESSPRSRARPATGLLTGKVDPCECVARLACMEAHLLRSGRHR